MSRTTLTRPRELIRFDSETDALDILAEPDIEAGVREYVRAPREVTYETPTGERAPGRLYEAGDRPAPVVVDVYGQLRPGFEPWIPLLVQSGYTVFQPAVECQQHTDEEHETIAGAARWVAERDSVDGETLVAYGHSHGGYNVCMQLGRYPERWSAGIALSAPLDLVAWEERATIPPHLYGILGDPDDNRERWRTQSPIENISSRTTPLLLVHGEHDQIPIEQAHRFVDALTAAGWQRDEDVEFVELSEQGHATRDVDRRIARWRPIMEFLERRL